MDADVVVVGAGIAGLAAGRALEADGFSCVVLERAAGVGGRCATRRIESVPVDHGLPFLQGADADFTSALAAVEDATPLRWPTARQGEGPAFSPDAFAPDRVRVAFREGITRFPKSLARGLDVRTGHRVTHLMAVERETLEVATASGGRLRARAVVLAMPVPQSQRVIEPLAPSVALRRLRPLLELPRWNATVAAIARYEDVEPSDWHLAFPGGAGLADVCHDSSKRAPGSPLTLVLHGRRAYSRSWGAASAPDHWQRQLLGEAAATLGSWIARPRRLDGHVWHHARTAAGTELAAPVAARIENGAVLAWCGDGFDSAGGAEGAFRSGGAAARRVAELIATSPSHGRTAGRSSITGMPAAG